MEIVIFTRLPDQGTGFFGNAHGLDPAKFQRAKFEFFQTKYGADTAARFFGCGFWGSNGAEYKVEFTHLVLSGCFAFIPNGSCCGKRDYGIETGYACMMRL
jgi:hypothetical protein